VGEVQSEESKGGEMQSIGRIKRGRSAINQKNQKGEKCNAIRRMKNQTGEKKPNCDHATHQTTKMQSIGRTKRGRSAMQSEESKGGEVQCSAIRRIKRGRRNQIVSM